jgi:hydroxyethylthiazole kinase-like uncharacterized protein yjeF
VKEKTTNSERILGSAGLQIFTELPLFNNLTSRTLEKSAARLLPPHTLMERAGLELARFAVALAPHAHVIWTPCGPGNNGGDGFEAAVHLQRWGKCPVITTGTHLASFSGDAAIARQKAMEAGVAFATHPPEQYDLCIDALFGIGANREMGAQLAHVIARINSQTAPVIAVDVPSGLNSETGATYGSAAFVRANYTLTFLTLKPGLFTANGRDASGEIWFNSLDVTEPDDPCAQLNRRPRKATRAHDTHKGSYGDVGVVGGEAGMTGAAMLASRAALRYGAGRVYVMLLDAAHPRFDAHQPELMYRTTGKLNYESLTVVAGCGGGTSIQTHLDSIVNLSNRLVLDADALNAIAGTPSLQNALRRRSAHTTVLTPHPLEAARLLGITPSDVQANRIEVAQTIANRLACTVALKGSGTVIAAPRQIPRVNATGNARLATAGTGDVLAGMIGALVASGGNVFDATCDAVFLHGQIADSWTASSNLTAQSLVESL